MATLRDEKPMYDLGRHSTESFGDTMTQERMESTQLRDELTMLEAERMATTTSLDKSRTRKEVVDEFGINSNPILNTNVGLKDDVKPAWVARMVKKWVQKYIWFRYLIYIVPVAVILLIPMLVGAIDRDTEDVGGTYLFWFSIWLEISWASLWIGRIIAKYIPYWIGLFASAFTDNSKQWRDVLKQLEVPISLTIWWTAVLCSFLPIMNNHQVPDYKGDRTWTDLLQRLIIVVLVLVVLNLCEKILIHYISIRFHQRTYADRIVNINAKMASLSKLWGRSKQKLRLEEGDWEAFDESRNGRSGTRTPLQYVDEARKRMNRGVRRFGKVAGKVAGDFAGTRTPTGDHPDLVVRNLLDDVKYGGAQVLARHLFRSYVSEGEHITPEDFNIAADNEEEAKAMFEQFDIDENGDISLSELESVCVDIAREKRTINASLKDTDGVVKDLGSIFMVIVWIIVVAVLITLVPIPGTVFAASAGSSILALSWLFSATAQELLQSIVFVFAKHPFDVGDRVSVYGNTGVSMKGDDYYVQKISLLYTEFRKMEGQVVQAPNSYLNTLFILNQRRSAHLAEAVPMMFKFGTTIAQIDALREELQEFVRSEKREFRPDILTEMRDIEEAHSVTVNIVFFYKTNWQNESLRLSRRNKFICALMMAVQNVGIEGPRMRLPGQKEDSPFFINYPSGTLEASQARLQPSDRPPNSQELKDHVQFHQPQAKSGNRRNSRDFDEKDDENSPFGDSEVLPSAQNEQEFTQEQSRMPTRTHPSILHQRSTARNRGESLSSMAKRVDFSLGMSDLRNLDVAGFDEFRRTQNLAKSSQDVAESSSVEPLQRIGTSESTSSRFRRGLGSVSRHRLFGRPSHDEVTQTQSADVLERGMAPIPEASYQRSGRMSPQTDVHTAVQTSTHTPNRASDEIEMRPFMRGDRI